MGATVHYKKRKKHFAAAYGGRNDQDKNRHSQFKGFGADWGWSPVLTAPGEGLYPASLALVSLNSELGVVDVPRGSCSHGISLGMSPSRPVPKPRCIPSPCARWMWYFPELPVLLAFVLLQSCRSLPPKPPWSSGIVWGQETWKGSLVGPCWVPCPARVCHS